MNISTSNIFLNMLLDKRFHQNYQAVLAALSTNGLIVMLLLVANLAKYKMMQKSFENDCNPGIRVHI